MEILGVFIIYYEFKALFKNNNDDSRKSRKRVSTSAV